MGACKPGSLCILGGWSERKRAWDIVTAVLSKEKTTQKLTNTVTGTGNAMGPILLQNNRFPIQDGIKLKKMMWDV